MEATATQQTADNSRGPYNSIPPLGSIDMLLVDTVTDRRWKFQLKPQSLNRTITARQSSTPTINGNRPTVQQSGISGDKLSIGDVLAIGVGITDGLDDLVIGGNLVMLVWGDREYGPALIASLTMNETEWDPISAEPTLVKVSLELEASHA